MPCSDNILDEVDIAQRLKPLPGWRYYQQALERVYEGRDYLDALGCLDKIARLSDAENHHPDLLLSWKTLTIRYWTHAAGGVTETDFRLARLVESVMVVPDGNRH